VAVPNKDMMKSWFFRLIYKDMESVERSGLMEE
jgi:hypothetical protein